MIDRGGEPLVVISAPNGARLDKTGHPGVPLSVGEIADCAEDLAEVGVSVLHLHVRDEQGSHVLDASHYRAAMDAIRERVGDKLVLQVTTEAIGQYHRQQQMALVRELQPEAVSLALGEFCPDVAAEDEAGRFFRDVLEAGTWPQYILYSANEVRRFERLRQAGFFGQDAPFVLFVLGRYSDSLRGDPADLYAFLDATSPGVLPWAVCCFGAQEAEAVRLAASLGGHVRIGFENNRTLPDGTLARDNAQLVAAELEQLAGSDASKRPIATAEWVRAHLAGT